MGFYKEDGRLTVAEKESKQGGLPGFGLFDDR